MLLSETVCFALGQCSARELARLSQSVQIWTDYQLCTFDRSLITYQPLINRSEVGRLEALKAKVEGKDASRCRMLL